MKLLRLAIPIFLAVALFAPQARAADEGDAAALEASLPKLRYVPQALFDPYFAEREWLLSGALLDTRPVDSSGPQYGGFKLAFGESRITRRGPLFLRLQLEQGVRVVHGDRVTIELGQYGYSAGIALGPVEVTARAGFDLANIGFGGAGFQLGFFSPTAGVGAAVTVWKFRLGVVAFAEYRWRWIGGPDERARGFLLDIALERGPKGLPARYHL